MPELKGLYGSYDLRFKYVVIVTVPVCFFDFNFPD